MSFAPVYLDWNATAPLADEVREAMLPWLGVVTAQQPARFGNPSSRHEYGRQALDAMDRARAQVAAAVGAHATEVLFTSGGSEANNLFLKGAAACRKPGTVAISAIEHPCVHEPTRQLARNGWQMLQIGVDAEGIIDRASWEQTLKAKPALISVMLANNETGVQQDIAMLAAEARTAGAFFHTDAAQALGKMEIDFRALGVNAMTLSGHKAGAPLGVGALVVDKRIELEPLIAGGGQERGLRSGTENVAAIVGFGRACELAAAQWKARAETTAALRNEIETAVRAMGATVFSAAAPRLPNTLFFAFEHLDGETMVGKLDRAGFACASGSACSSAQPEPSRTLMAMGVDPLLAQAAIRVSLGPTSKAEDVQRFVQVLDQVRKDLQRLASIAS